jgi:PhnB protein
MSQSLTAEKLQTKPKPVPDGTRTVTPHLICGGAAKAIDFYKKAFGAEELMRLPAPDGSIMHACIKIGDSAVFLVDENSGCGMSGPLALKGSPVTLHLSVEDADALVARAVKAGAEVTMPVTEVATHVKDVTVDEIQKAAKAMSC